MEADIKADTELDKAKARADYEKASARWKKQAAKAKAEGKQAPKKPGDPSSAARRRGGMGGLFNGKIAPLIPYAIRGAIWYQGEANANPGKGKLYRYQLPLLVDDWRQHWGEELPFAWVQLPNFRRDGEGWMLVREAMLKTLRLPRTGMAVTIDIGDSNNIHPTNKQEVGERLALWALGEVYGRKGRATSGPLPAGHEVRGANRPVLHARDGGLQARGGELKGFVIAGEDQQWKPASARSKGTRSSSPPGGQEPVAVRYAWEADPVLQSLQRRRTARVAFPHGRLTYFCHATGAGRVQVLFVVHWNTQGSRSASPHCGAMTTSKSAPLIFRSSSCRTGRRGSGATEMAQSMPLSATNMP